MSIWNTLSNPNQFDGDVRKRYFQKTQEFVGSHPLLYQRIATVDRGLKKTYTNDSIEEVGKHYEPIAEGIQAAPLMVPRTVAKLKHYARLYGLALMVTERMMDADIYGYIMKFVGRFPELAQRTIEKDFVQTFLNTGATYDPIRDQRDGKALFALNHNAGQSGFVYANTVGTGQAASEATIGAALSYFDTIYDDSGMLAPLAPRQVTLVCHPSRYLANCQIVQSTATLTSGLNAGVKNIANKDSNAMNMQITVERSGYISSPTAWFLKATDLPQDYGDLETVFRQEPGNPEKNVERNPNYIEWFDTMDYLSRPVNPRVIFYNPGA